MAFYDDPEFDYQTYWESRQYEHLSEVIAIRRLLNNQKFQTAVDIGGGYGRLTAIIAEYADKTILLEPSAKMRSAAKSTIKNLPARNASSVPASKAEALATAGWADAGGQLKIKIAAGTTEKTNLPDASQDLVTCFRVLHHIPDLENTFTEFNRILKPGGTLLFEFANSANLKARLAHWLLGQPLLRTSIERRSSLNIRNQTIPFVNHHPDTILKLLNQQGFKNIKTLSVSNFRHDLFKKIVPIDMLIGLEQWLQEPMGSLFIGPSIFVLTTK